LTGAGFCFGRLPAPVSTKKTTMNDTIAASRQDKTDGSATRREVRFSVSGGDALDRHAVMRHLDASKTCFGVPYRAVDMGPNIEDAECETWEERRGKVPMDLPKKQRHPINEILQGIPLTHKGVGEGDAGLKIKFGCEMFLTGRGGFFAHHCKNKYLSQSEGEWLMAMFLAWREEGDGRYRWERANRDEISPLDLVLFLPGIFRYLSVDGGRVVVEKVKFLYRGNILGAEFNLNLIEGGDE